MRVTLEQCRNIAKEKNGLCLSGDYINSTEKLLWQCDKGHQWYIQYNKVQQGRWCPFCAGLVKKTTQDCYNLAKSRNGKFLSENYVNSSTNYKWKCAYSHVWLANYHNVQAGHWCPVCAKEKRKQTMIRLYGVENPGQSKDIRNKVKKTNLKKYGVAYAMQNKEIALKSAKSSNNSFILFHWKTNEELICVGSYEKKVVEWLNRNQIIYLWQPKNFQLQKNTTYRPDLFLVKENKWIEVKGYFRNDAKEKWDWFHKEYPNSELWDRNKLKEIGIL